MKRVLICALMLGATAPCIAGDYRANIEELARQTSIAEGPPDPIVCYQTRLGFCITLAEWKRLHAADLEIDLCPKKRPSCRAPTKP